ncbi:MAG: hypothetical protein ACOCTG_04780 [Bacteroidota bacterium]
MNNRFVNTLLIVSIALLVAGAGYYVTGVQQPAEMQRIEDAQKLARMEKAEVEQLLVEESRSEELADEAVRKWRARYKYVPAAMETADILQYLEGLSRTGFEAFNIEMQGITNTRDFKYYTFILTGTAYYDNLYDLIWSLENNREFYRIQDLNASYVDVFDENPDTGERRRLSMVKFNMVLLAYFDGIEGLTARHEELMPVPAQLLPVRRPVHNAFFPQIRPDPPPNDELLVEMEKATLVSIIGGKAIVEDERGQHVLEVGDPVYLGEIVRIDPININVEARLNKAGVVEIIRLALDDEQTAPHRRAMGDQQLRSIEQ